MSTTQNKKYVFGEHEYSNEDLAILGIGIACDKKAARPMLLDLRHLSGAFTEYFAIVSVSNSRQAYAVAEEIRMFFKKAFDLRPVAVDGLEESTWVLLDFGFMFIHVFQESTRAVYQLEQLWGKARHIATEPEDYEPLYKPIAQGLVSSAEQDTHSDMPFYT